MDDEDQSSHFQFSTTVVGAHGRIEGVRYISADGLTPAQALASLGDEFGDDLPVLRDGQRYGTVHAIRCEERIIQWSDQDLKHLWPGEFDRPWGPVLLNARGEVRDWKDPGLLGTRKIVWLIEYREPAGFGRRSIRRDPRHRDFISSDEVITLDGRPVTKLPVELEDPEPGEETGEELDPVIGPDHDEFYGQVLYRVVWAFRAARDWDYRWLYTDDQRAQMLETLLADPNVKLLRRWDAREMAAQVKRQMIVENLREKRRREEAHAALGW